MDEELMGGVKEKSQHKIVAIQKRGGSAGRMDRQMCC